MQLFFPKIFFNFQFIVVNIVLMKILWILLLLLEKIFHPTMTPINNGFIFLLHLITHSLCENRHRCHGSWLKIVLKSTSQKKMLLFLSACTRKKFWQNKSFLYLGNRPSGTYIMRWLTVAKNLYIPMFVCVVSKGVKMNGNICNLLVSVRLLNFFLGVKN